MADSHRAKSIETDEWIVGDKLDTVEGQVLIGELVFGTPSRESLGCGVEDRGCVDRYDGAEYGYNLAIEDMLQNTTWCYPETLGRRTVCNGTTLFEGDVFFDEGTGSFHDKSYTYSNWCLVKFNEAKQAFVYETHSGERLLSNYRKDVVVAGNIIDNPELVGRQPLEKNNSKNTWEV